MTTPLVKPADLIQAKIFCLIYLLEFKYLAIIILVLIVVQTIIKLDPSMTVNVNIANDARPKEQVSKRSRGRPKGSSRFVESDNEKLIEAADRIVRNPDLKLAPVFKGLGYQGDSEIRRMRSHWNKRSEQLLTDAQQRWDAEPPKTILNEFTSFLVTFGGWVDILSKSPVVQDLKTSMQNATRRRDIRQQFGNNSKPPFDITDPEKSRKALSRFTEREHQTIEKLSGALPEDKTLAELPLSTKLEIASMLLHEMSLDQLENEQAEATDPEPNKGTVR